MPLYVTDCMTQLQWPISISLAVIATAIPPYLTKWWYGSSFIEFHEKDAVSFWFGKGRLAVLTISLLYSTVRLIYECVNQDLFAILLAARVLGFLIQLFDHYWMQHHWIPYFVLAEKRIYLWIRFYIVIIGFLTYKVIYQIQMGIVENYDISCHQYVLTTFFYASLHFSFLCWFLWFFLRYRSGIAFDKASKFRIDVQRLVRFRFHILRNSLATWIPFQLILGMVGIFAGDGVPHEDLNDDTLQWRYAFMIAALLSVLCWVIHKFIVIPNELSEQQVLAIDNSFPDADVINARQSMSSPMSDQPPPPSEIHLDHNNDIATGGGAVEKPSTFADTRSQFPKSVPFVESISRQYIEVQSKPLLSLSTKSDLSDDTSSQQGNVIQSPPSFTGSLSTKSNLSDEIAAADRLVDTIRSNRRQKNRKIEEKIDELDISNRIDLRRISSVSGTVSLCAMAESPLSDEFATPRTPRTARKNTPNTPRRNALTIQDVHTHHKRSSFGSSSKFGSEDIHTLHKRSSFGDSNKRSSFGDSSQVRDYYASAAAAAAAVVTASTTINNTTPRIHHSTSPREFHHDDGKDEDEHEEEDKCQPDDMIPRSRLNSLSHILSISALQRVHSLVDLFPHRMDLTHLLEIKKWEIFERTADKWVCIFYQIIVWNVIVTVSQDMLGIYLDHSLHWMNYYCPTIVPHQTLNSVQFLFDHLIA